MKNKPVVARATPALPKTLIGFYAKCAARPFAGLLIFWSVVDVINQILNGVIMPLSHRWLVELFERPVPEGLSFLEFALPTIALILAFNLAIDAFEIMQSILNARGTAKIRDRISIVLTEYLHGQSMSFWTRQIAGKINAQVGYINGAFFTFQRFLKIFATCCVILLNVGMLLGINRWVAYILVVVFFIRLGYSAILIRHMNRASKDMSESSSALSGKYTDGIMNYLIVKLFAGFKSEEKHLAAPRQKVIDNLIRFRFVNRLFWAVPSFVWDIGLGLVLVASVLLYQKGGMAVSDVVFSVSAYHVVMSSIGGLVNQIPDMVESLGAATHAYHKLVRPLAVADAPDAADLAVDAGAIEFKKVSFKYHKKMVLDKFSLRVRPGEKVGLVGGSGAGKTTMVNLLMRLYDPSAGAIFIDGQNIGSVTQDSLRKNIAFIPQEPSLFNRTLKDNIEYGRPGASDKDVRAAAERAEADGFIMQTPKKYNSMVGDRGVKLSVGQKQRVAIARAFLKDAPILVLDEATSALDSETERAIQKSFAELSRGRTTIAIAHRLSTLRDMDRIVVIEDGKIKESGAHNELLKKPGGVYARLWKMQSGGFL